MALIIEDGTNVANANSYQSTADFKVYANARDIDYAAFTDPLIDALLIKAMDFIEAKRERFQGCKTTDTQSLQWPRSSVKIDGVAIADNVIPQDLKSAQLQLAVDAMTTDLTPSRLPSDKGRVKRDRLEGVSDVEYETSSSVSTPRFAQAESLLRPLYKQYASMLVRG